MKKIVTVVLTLVIAFVFLQSLPFKFTNSFETQHIFNTLADWSGLGWFGVYGGFLVGSAELIASLFLLIPIIGGFIKKEPFLPVLHSLGAVMAIGIMTGAIFFHLFTPLGIVQPYFDLETGIPNGDDSGLLFIMACITWISAVVLVIMDWKSPASELKKLIGK